MIKLIYSDSFAPSLGAGAFIETADKELNKSASTVFQCDYSDIKPPKGHVGVHVVALGSEESYGPNRNADGFPKAANKKYHESFEKNSHVFEHHQNKDPLKKLGDVVKSAYNEEMDRIELFIHADEKKASKHLDRMEKEGSTTFSMACTVPNDRCSRCNTLRKTAKDPDQCDHVKHELGKLAEDGSLTYVHNDQPKFFDISFVTKPADRTAYGFKKAASSVDFVSGLELAVQEDITLPDSILLKSSAISSRVELIEKLAEFERYYQGIHNKPVTDTDYYFTQLSKAASDSFDSSLIEELRDYPPEIVFNKLADSGIILSITDFYKYAFGPTYGEVASHMDGASNYSRDGIFSTIVDSRDTVKVASDNQFDVVTPSYTYIPNSIITKLAFLQSFTTDVKAKVIANVADGKTPKLVLIKSSKVQDTTAKYLAYKYASYKTAMLERMFSSKADINKTDVIALAVTQNLFN